MDSKESVGGGNPQDWQGPHTVVVPRSESGLGFTLRHFVVYPPPSVLDDSQSEQDYDLKGDRSSFQREASLEPQDTIFVKSVRKGSAAQLAGLNTGDRIVAVNGDSVNGKSYGEVIGLIQNSPKNLKLLVVPKDDDILQMAYQSSGDQMYSSTGSLSEVGGHYMSIHQPAAEDYIPYGYKARNFDSIRPSDIIPYKRYSPASPRERVTPRQQWNNKTNNNSVSDLSATDRVRSKSSTSVSIEATKPIPDPTRDTKSSSGVTNPQQSRQMSQDQGSKMSSSSFACNIPSKTKYSFGLYFPPKGSKSSQQSSISSNPASSNRLSSATEIYSSQGAPDVVESNELGKSSQAQMAAPRRPDVTAMPRGRKASLDESSTGLSTTKSKEFFIRYTADKSASDARQRYSSRHSAYERTPSEKPHYVISRSQTVSTFSPAGNSQRSSFSGGSGSVVRHSVEIPSRRSSEDLLDYKSDSFYRPPSVVSSSNSGDNRSVTSSVEGTVLRGGKTTLSQGDLSGNNTNVGGRQTFVVRIPRDQQQQQPQQQHLQQQQQQQVVQPNQGGELIYDPSIQMYGTTFAVTRSPAVTRIEIQKKVGMPTVSHRKHLFESGQNENNPPPFIHNGHHNRYKTEIEKIRTQPKFSSVATRMASFEQSPDRDSPSLDGSQEKLCGSGENLSASVETAQPTIKVRKISTERHSPSVQVHSSGNSDSTTTTVIRGGFTEPSPIHIYVSSGNATSQSAPIVEIVSRHIPQSSDNSSFKQVVRNDGKLILQQKSSQPDDQLRTSPALGNSGATVGNTVLWSSKSFQGAGDMVDGNVKGKMADSGDQDVTSAAQRQSSKPARKTSYLSAVNAPRVTMPVQEGRGVHTQAPQSMFAQSQAVVLPLGPSLSPASSSSSLVYAGPGGTSSIPSSSSEGGAGPFSPTPQSSYPHPHPQHQARPYSTPQSTSKPVSSSSSCLSPRHGDLEVKGHPGFPSSASANSLSSVIGSEMSSSSIGASLAPSVMSVSDSALPLDRDGHHQTDTTGFGSNSFPVQMRRKPVETYEDQANKLHRRTSYLMATARDRTNTVPIEKAFCPQPISEQPQSVQQPAVSQSSSAKLNKFFGEKIPSIAEGLESHVEEEEPPEIIRRGPLYCKVSVWESKKCSDRSWKQVYAVLRANELFLTRDKEGSTSSHFEDHHVPLRAYMVEFARDYAKKKKNVFRLTTHDECVYLFHAEDRGSTLCWFQAIKGINEPDKNDNTSTPEQSKHAPVEINIIPATTKTSPPTGHKSKKLFLKAKLASSPSMRRKKSNASEKDKDEVPVKKSWKGRLPMMKNLRKHSEDNTLQSRESETDNVRQFGVHLEDCFPSPHNEFVPLIVELCTRIVEARGLEVIGVYRVPGNSAAVNALTEEFNNGIDNVNIDNEKLLDINVISSLLKSFFRKLPEPLVNSESYDGFIEANRNPDPDKRMLKLKRLLHLLPPHHNETFKHIAEHLYRVASYGNINKMDARNLALMFGPTLIRKTEDDTVSLVTDMSDQCRIIESIILHCEWFFSPWDQDSHIPMETTVETVCDEGHGYKDDDEEADSAISTKEIISSIVGAASRKLRNNNNQQQKSSQDSIDGRSITHASETSLCSAYTTSSNSKRATAGSLLDHHHPHHLSALSKSETSLASGHSTTDDGFSSHSKSTSPVVIPKMLVVAPMAKSEPESLDLEFADAAASSPITMSSNISSSASPRQHYSSESLLMDKNDELEISHGQEASMSRDAIHNTLKRIGNDVYTLLQTFEQKQLKERERWRREQEHIEREHQRTQMELEEEEDIHSIDDWLALKSSGAPPSSRAMPDVVSSSYIGETYPYVYGGSPSSSSEGDSRKEREMRGGGMKPSGAHLSTKNYHSRHGSFDSAPPPQSRPPPVPGPFDDFVPPSSTDTIQRAVMSKSMTHATKPSTSSAAETRQKNIHLAVDKQHLRPSSIRNSMGHRHGSLDSLIDLIDKRSSWASSDSEDGADLLTSLTTTFDQKLKILVNPKYKLTGMSSRKHLRNESGIPATLVSEAKELRDSSAPLRPLEGNKQQPPPQQSLPSALIDPERSFRDPSLHRSSKPEAKVGIASRFERNDNRALSSSPVMNNSQDQPSSTGRNSKKGQVSGDFRSFIGRQNGHLPRETGAVMLTQPRKLDDSGIIVLRSINKGRKSESQRSYSKSEKTELNTNLARLNKEGKGQSSTATEDENGRKQDNKENEGRKRSEKRHGLRRHTVGGTEDFEHIDALVQVCGNNEVSSTASSATSREARQQSAWEQLQPLVKDTSVPWDRSLQAWMHRERMRGSTPDLSAD